MVYMCDATMVACRNALKVLKRQRLQSYNVIVPIRDLTSSEKKYDETLCLPKTDFPMRADAARREPLIQKNVFHGLYGWQRTNLNRNQKNPSSAAYILHDGPPFANGSPHIGHALNKILKDVIGRYRMLRGDSISFIPGWDCHGLPIEVLASAAIKSSAKEGLDQLETAARIRTQARGIAEKAIDIQMSAFQRWGVLADWMNPYLTMDRRYEARQLAVFNKMVQRGLIQQGFKPVYWSPSSKTALAEAELEYHDHTSKAVYVNFKLLPADALQKVISSAGATDVCALAWTTTPWTLPSNQALAINERISYVLVEVVEAEVASKWMLMAADTVDSVLTAIGATRGRVVDVDTSHILESHYEALFDVRGEQNGSRRFIEASYITSTSGTGIVHSAPAHGIEDFVACEKQGISIEEVLVNDYGKFSAAVGNGLVGLECLTKGNDAVIALLKEKKLLAAVADYEHRYPYDWRTRKPVMLRATDQWFLDLTTVAPKAQAALDQVWMLPESGKNRLQAMLNSRTDWCISRQRAWGVPIPVFYHEHTGEALMTDASIKHVIQLVEQHGVDCWWTLSVEELLAPQYRESGPYRRGMDTMDVWFDSGSSWHSVVQEREGDNAVADLYLEGSDQHRGWFQSSLLTSVIANNNTAQAPYKGVITHGFVVDATGRKMSKSLKNGVDPNIVIEGGGNKKKEPAYGADLLRVWVASSSYHSDVGIGSEILKSTFEQFRKIRNCGRFLLGNLYDFDPTVDVVDMKDMTQLDQYMLHVAATTLRTIEDRYDNHAFAQVYSVIAAMVNGYLNSFYFDIAKDSLYCDGEISSKRKSSQTVLHHMLNVLTAGIAPIAVHLAEEMNSFSNGVDPTKAHSASVIKKGWPVLDQAWIQPQLANDWETVRSLRRLTYRAVEAAKQTDTVKTASDAVITVVVPPELADVLDRVVQHSSSGLDQCDNHTLEDIFMCSQFEVQTQTSTVVATDAHLFEDMMKMIDGTSLTIKVGVNQTSKHKCPRCWRFASGGDDGGNADVDLCKRCSTIVG
eukprot:m.163756 g.163756  ORF g.163756 m.163756 type:complete len:1026 (-) comp31304_c1_seq1:167-3244(-)